MVVKLVVALTIALLAGVAVLIFWDPCVRPEITVANASGASLTELSVSGVGFDEAIGALEPGESVAKSVDCGAESGLMVSFAARGVPHSSEDLAYIEGCGGYRVRLTVKEDFSVAVVSDGPY